MNSGQLLRGRAANSAEGASISHLLSSARASAARFGPRQFSRGSKARATRSGDATFCCRRRRKALRRLELPIAGIRGEMPGGVKAAVRRQEGLRGASLPVKESYNGGNEARCARSSQCRHAPLVTTVPRRDAMSWTLQRPSPCLVPPLCGGMPRLGRSGVLRGSLLSAPEGGTPERPGQGIPTRERGDERRQAQPRMGRRNKAHGDALRAVGSGRAAEPTPAVSSAPYGATEPCFGKFAPGRAFRSPIRG